MRVRLKALPYLCIMYCLQTKLLTYLVIITCFFVDLKISAPKLLTFFKKQFHHYFCNFTDKTFNFMNQPIRELEPKGLWNHFADLNAVPRPSKKEEKVIEFMLSFGKQLGLETHKDQIGNVIIKKPATPGLEDRKTVVLQSHLDMVHQKNNDTDFDFDQQGIEMYIDGDWVKAKGTTLGADNGIGVATIMAILASKDINHPAIEALFTIDEETGMTGAMELD